ncbi:HD domain-containing protein [Comamonas sediminis]|uniref:HD domain-containing protein n=1 Tax=Comamonas sediminis TaxID=1783360 RepID=A0ABV4AXV0_9BURK
MHIVEKARIFATAAHYAIDQKRKYTNEPYIHHPKAVVNLLLSISENEEVLAAAWLHDIIEDTSIKLETIEEEFGFAVANLVREVTNISRSSDGNRAHRKAIDRTHSAAASPSAKSIKLADIIDNLPSIKNGNPDFAKVYIAEQKLLLEVLKEGSTSLYTQAERLLE